jgi:NAD(P)H-dependent FMN reductase
VNAAVMRAALANQPDGATLTELDVSTIPFYNGDVEESGTLPDSVTALHETVAGADGMLFFTPEYNGSYPAVTKNVIDWLSRPPAGWTGKGISLVVTTPGPRAGQNLREHFDGMFSLGIGSYGEILGEDGEVSNAETIAALTEYVAAFAERCRAD